MKLFQFQVSLIKTYHPLLHLCQCPQSNVRLDIAFYVLQPVSAPAHRFTLVQQPSTHASTASRCSSFLPPDEAACAGQPRPV